LTRASSKQAENAAAQKVRSHRIRTQFHSGVDGFQRLGGILQFGQEGGAIFQ
jgi:hypothetical protein